MAEPSSEIASSLSLKLQPILADYDSRLEHALEQARTAENTIKSIKTQAQANAARALEADSEVERLNTLLTNERAWRGKNGVNVLEGKVQEVMGLGKEYSDFGNLMARGQAEYARLMKRLDEEEEAGIEFRGKDEERKRVLGVIKEASTMREVSG
jgi:succinate dehydrogenase/fumarate reductase flavoprotein subunit